TDTFTCPAGQTLKRRKFFKKRQHYEYIAAAGTCYSCRLKPQCTKAKEAGNKSSRTKPYGLSQLFDLQWSDIAGFCLTLEKLLLYRHAAITG
ncbi:hypothetical protein D1BOALGB6SA_2501, partial [Olavius sp. associated proteobacterium Delta 1]